MEIPLSLANSKARIPSRPQKDLGAKGEIYFSHPGYPAPNTLLTLAPTDCENSNGVTVFGVHHETALLACQIIANNAFHCGYFALDSAGLQRVDVPLHGLLTKGRYYFHIDGIDQYPVVPSFRDWRFPHGEIENIWPSHPSDDLINPSFCPLSGFSYALKMAHIIPREEYAWFAKNEMSSDRNINNSGNIIPLRKDLHKCFDDRWFVIIPKPTSSGTRYVTHVLSLHAAEIWPDYHNIELRCLMQPYGRNFLFARFAWAIIQQVKGFVTNGVQRKVARIITKQSGQVEYLVSDVGGPLLQHLYGGGGSRSATPMKRKFGALASDDCEDFFSNNCDWDPYWNLSTPLEKQQMQSHSGTLSGLIPLLPEDKQKELVTSAADLIASQNLHEVEE
ncbi:hypothetical protein HDV63DRAFT_383706 [Trichoderma sp. SZMC 28014]